MCGYLVPRIKLSKIAEEVLFQTIVESGIPPGKGLRLKKFEGGLMLSIDSSSQYDRIIKKRDNRLIVVDKELEKQIGSATIDIINTRKKLKLMIIKHEKGEAF